MTAALDQLADTFGAVAQALQEARARPHGPAVSTEGAQVAGRACVALCHGSQDQARTLWKLIVQDCGGYMPQSVALALVRASNVTNLVPDVEAPTPT